LLYCNDLVKSSTDYVDASLNQVSDIFLVKILCMFLESQSAFEVPCLYYTVNSKLKFQTISDINNEIFTSLDETISDIVILTLVYKKINLLLDQ